MTRRTFTVSVILGLFGCGLSGVFALQAGDALEKTAILNFYLFCSQKEDSGFLEWTDEIYLLGAYTYPGGQGVIKVGTDDYRDGGDKERWRDYIALATCQLKPGEAMYGHIKVMDDDGNFQKVINEVNGVVQQVPNNANNGSGDDWIKIFKGIVVGAVALAKGEDDELAAFDFEIKNDGGNLVLKVDPTSDSIVDREATTDRDATDGSGKVTLQPFRIKKGCNYHAAMWLGPPKKN